MYRPRNESPPHRAIVVATAVALCLSVPGGVTGQSADTDGASPDRGPCAESAAPRPPGPDADVAPTGPARDLYCIDLLPPANLGGPSGRVELGRAAGPFGTTVTPDGTRVSRLTGWFDGLPDPSTLGSYTTYVAWATTPVFSRIVKLGEVGNGRYELGEVDLNTYLVLVSAEASADVSEREGRLVLRGRSPSSLMDAHDLLAQAPSALRVEGGDTMSGHGMAGHDMSGDGMAESARWVMPPGYPGIQMLPGMTGLEPAVTPMVPAPSDLSSEVVADLDLPTSVDALPLVRPADVVELPDGGTLDLEAGFVRREIAGRSLVMMAFNGQHPGPLIRVREASTIFVNFTNATPMPTAVHWHGIRLDNRYDGVPGVTQEPVQPGETFQYRIRFPDAGLYWYHPHHREDVQQEMGLYGNLMVESLDEAYYGPANRDEVLMLDDILLDEDGLVPFGRESSNYMLMGRFGNVLLVNGEPDWGLEVDRGEVVRFHITNVSNTRTFNVSFRGEDGSVLPLKAVASDVSRFERESWTRSAVLAPAERYVVEVRFDSEGRFQLVNAVQAIDHRQGVYRPETTVLGVVDVRAEAVADDHGHAHAELRENEEVVRDIDRYRDRFDDPPDHTLVLSLEVENLPRVIRQSMLYDWEFFNPVEWAGTMPMMNWATSGEEVRWILRDTDADAENMEIAWNFQVGDVVRIRIHNDRNAFHAMQHPLHIHGQRFLVLEQNGAPTENLVWKDTVLLPPGSTTDILLELSNPGRWMVHCHIAEHLESGMKFVMNVEESR